MRNCPPIVPFVRGNCNKGLPAKQAGYGGPAERCSAAAVTRQAPGPVRCALIGLLSRASGVRGWSQGADVGGGGNDRTACTASRLSRGIGREEIDRLRSGGSHAECTGSLQTPGSATRVVRSRNLRWEWWALLSVWKQCADYRIYVLNWQAAAWTWQGTFKAIARSVATGQSR